MTSTMRTKMSETDELRQVMAALAHSAWWPHPERWALVNERDGLARKGRLNQANTAR
jgi:hypothetical protein